MVDDLLELFKYIISLPAIFGASIWLGFYWRRLTKWAVIIQVFICLAIYAIIPNLFPSIDSINRNEKMLIETVARDVIVETEALTEDVEAGLALKVGDIIEKPHTVQPVGIFFDQIIREDAEDLSSAKVGSGRFHAEIWVLSWFGIDFSHWAKAQLVAIRFLFDAVFPFIFLFLISFFTRSVPKALLDRFFTKMHTPVQPDDEQEALALNSGYDNPDKFEEEKMFPKSKWEFRKWKKIDSLGFGLSWLLVAVVIFLLWLVTTIR
jgi:SSS family solute:Na+ symporter